jgi:hypothetical protein
MNNLIYKPPQNIAFKDAHKKYIFLAGSIEQGKAIDWQADITEFLNTLDIGVFNPRRDDWNSSWEQTYENPQFSQQVNWELNALDKADRILMYLVPETISPISLLELGLYANSKKMAVVCPTGYWRKGNVEIICANFDIPLFDNLDAYKHYIATLNKNSLI